MERILFLLVTVLTLQACSARVAEEEVETVNAYSKECIAKTGVDKDSFRKFAIAEADDQDKLMAEDEKLQKFVVCVCTKIGYITTNGTVQKVAIKKRLNKYYFTDAAKVDKIVDKCAVQKDVAWKTANEMRKCFETQADLLDME